MPVAVSFNLKIRSESSAYHVSRSPSPPVPFPLLSAHALLCTWAVLPAFAGSIHLSGYGSGIHRKTDSCLKLAMYQMQRRCGSWHVKKNRRLMVRPTCFKQREAQTLAPLAPLAPPAQHGSVNQQAIHTVQASFVSFRVPYCFHMNFLLSGTGHFVTIQLHCYQRPSTQ